MFSNCLISLYTLRMHTLNIWYYLIYIWCKQFGIMTETISTLSYLCSNDIWDGNFNVTLKVHVIYTSDDYIYRDTKLEYKRIVEMCLRRETLHKTELMSNTIYFYPNWIENGWFTFHACLNLFPRRHLNKLIT